MLNKINWELFEKQKTFVIFLFLILYSVGFLLKNISGSLKKEDLLLNVNTAEREQLLSVPYIGEKNVEDILRIRNDRRIEDIEELRNIRFYSRFKYFLKAE